MGWGGRWEGGSGWGTHINPWLIHANVWQKPVQYCKVISLKLIKMKRKKKKKHTHRHREQTYNPQYGGEIGWEFGTDMYKLIYLK